MVEETHANAVLNLQGVELVRKVKRYIVTGVPTSGVSLHQNYLKLCVK